MKISRAARSFGTAIGTAVLGAVMVAGPAAAGGASAEVSPDPLVRGGDVTITFSCPGYSGYHYEMYGQPSNNDVTPSGSLNQAGYAQDSHLLDFLDPADTAVLIVAYCTGEGTAQVIEDTFPLVDHEPTTTSTAPPPTVAPAIEAPPAPAAPAELPRTGSNVGLLSVIAVLTLAGGIALVVRTRIRHA